MKNWDRIILFVFTLILVTIPALACQDDSESPAMVHLYYSKPGSDQGMVWTFFGRGDTVSEALGRARAECVRAGYRAENCEMAPYEKKQTLTVAPELLSSAGSSF